MHSYGLAAGALPKFPNCAQKLLQALTTGSAAAEQLQPSLAAQQRGKAPCKIGRSEYSTASIHLSKFQGRILCLTFSGECRRNTMMKIFCRDGFFRLPCCLIFNEADD